MDKRGVILEMPSDIKEGRRDLTPEECAAYEWLMTRWLRKRAHERERHFAHIFFGKDILGEFVDEAVPPIPAWIARNHAALNRCDDDASESFEAPGMAK